ncbi:MAG: HAD-IA family hydrolase [Chloroflexi bacterium]|nr:HAD-IA family hydrolase [Chloroflexota bacterium]
MIKAILFDLDNTLITNPAARFVRSYVQILTPFLHHQFPHIDLEIIQHGLRAAIQCTIADQNPLTSNWQVFSSEFTARTGIEEAELRPQLEYFYAELYPQLQELVTAIPEAVSLVDWLISEGYAVAITTNPLFEASPIHQRMGWGGLNLDNGFAYITTLRTTHFTKPNPQYYEEVLARIGVEPEEALMVGDDWGNDILAAKLCGMNTFWIEQDEQMHAHPAETPDIFADAQGTLADLQRLITKENWLSSLTPHPLTISQIAPRMQGNLAALLGMVDEVPDHYWHQHPDPDEWSPFEIVYHLLDSERTVQRPRLERILKDDNPFLSAPPPPPGPGQMDLPDLTGHEIAMLFARERQRTLDLLGNIEAWQWQREARHSVLGPTNLLEMAAFTTRHDHLHITQLCQTLGRCE